jgi:hypothetical protein
MPAATLSRSDEKSARKNTFQPPAKGAGKDQPKVQPKPEHKILYQTYFKSVGTRTYAAQVKEAGNRNHFLLLTEGRRDKETGELRKTSVIVFSEDFEEFFKMVCETREFVHKNPVPPEVARKQQKFWSKQQDLAGNSLNAK